MGRIGHRVKDRLARARIAGPPLERGMLGVDECPPLGGILRQEEVGQRHVGEEGIRVIGVAIGHGQFHRLDDRMNRLGAVASHRFEVDALEDLQGLEQIRPLGPRPALVDRPAAISDGDRLLDPRRVGGQVSVADEPSVGPGPRVDAAGDRPSVERVGDQSEPPRAVAGRRVRAGGIGQGLGGDERIERPRQIGVPGLATRRAGE